MPTKEERDRLIGEVVRFLYENGMNKWPVQDKGVLVGAIKLQLEEKQRDIAGTAQA